MRAITNMKLKCKCKKDYNSGKIVIEIPVWKLKLAVWLAIIKANIRLLVKIIVIILVLFISGHIVKHI